MSALDIKCKKLGCIVLLQVTRLTPVLSFFSLEDPLRVYLWQYVTEVFICPQGTDSWFPEATGLIGFP